MSDDKVTLDVELKANVAELVNSFEKLDKAGGFKDNSGGRAQLAAQAKHFKQLDFKNLSNKDLTAFAQEIQKFSSALLNAAKKMADPSVGKAIEKINILVAAAEKAVQSAQSKLESKTANVSLKTSKNGRASVLKALNEGTYDRKSLVFDNDTLFANLPDFLKRNKKGQQYTNKAYALQRTRELLADEDALKALPEKQRKQVYDYQDNWLGTDTKIPEKMKALANEIEKLAEDSQQAQLKLAALRAETQKIANSNSSDTGTKLVGDITKQSIDIQSGVRGLKDEKTVEQQQAKAAKESKENMDAATKSANKHSNAISNVVKQYFSWRIIGGLLRKAMNGVVQTIQELDKSLTEQAMVTGLTRDQTYGLIESYQALAKQTGATTTEVAAVVTEYLKQGESINDSLQLAEAAISSAKVARVSVSDSINYLTTALRGYRLEADQAMQVSDKFAALAAASATDYDELAVALSKVASQANLAGMSMDYTLALLTQGLETTREAPETMGTALKTIIARMRELTDYGKTLEGDADINTVESQLAYVGIDLRDDNGALRSTEEVLDELGRKWEKLNTNQQAALAKALAGTRQQSRLIALLDDYDRVLEFQQISLQSTGATAAQSATYLQGMEAAINNIKVAYEGIVTSVSNNELIIGFLEGVSNFLTSIGNALKSVPNTIGLIVTAIVGYIAVRTLANLVQAAYIKQIKEETGSTILSAAADSGKVATLLALTGATKLATVASKAFKAVLDSMKSHPIIAALSVALTIATIIAGIVMSLDLRPQIEKTKEKVNELSAEIYTLNQRAQSIQQVTDAAEELDNKLIKTKEDAEELNTQLEGVADKLSEEQQETYANLETKAEKLAFLEQVQADSIEEANQKRQEQLKLLESLSETERQQIWEGTDSASSNTRDAVRAIVNNDAYSAINAMSDLTSQESIDLQEITQSFLESADAATAYQWALDGVGSTIAELVSSARKIKTEDGEIAAFSVLNSSDYSLKEQVEAYEAIQDSLRGDAEALNAFNKTYSQYETFQKMGDDVLDFIDKVDLTIDEINELWSAWEDLQAAGVNITQEQYEGRFENFMKTLTATGGDIASTVDMVFGDILAQFTEGTEEWEDAYNTFINSFADLVSVGILQTTQDMDSLMNTISNFYDKAGDWSTMSESDKGEFISDNADLFAGASGQELLRAFESGNYSAIQQALSSNEGLQDRLQNMRDQIDQELKIEEARVGDARNEAYIAQLKQYKAYLEDEENLFMASLEVRLEQEQDQLDTYKDYLEQRRDALQDELDKEKEAYQDYFDAINQQEEQEDYDEQANLLITNISKLASSTNASSQSQMRDLTDQLEDLEEERLQTLRENAQQAVLDNINDTIDEISDKFDDLLDSNQALLAAMTADMENPTSFVSGMIASQVSQGATALELEDYIQNLQSVYGASGIDLSGVSVSTDNNNNLILNVNGREYNLSSGDQQTVYEAIMKALTQIGLK